VTQNGWVPFRVLVVEDFLPFAVCCARLWKEVPTWMSSAKWGDGLEAVQESGELRPDLILLDIGLPTLNGIEAARQIRKRSPESKIVFVSQESDPEIVQGALGLGAWGYVAKATAASDLLAAIESVRDGRQFVSDCLVSISMTQASEPPTAIKKP